jgi:hypothetical protein
MLTKNIQITKLSKFTDRIKLYYPRHPKTLFIPKTYSLKYLLDPEFTFAAPVLGLRFDPSPELQNELQQQLCLRVKHSIPTHTRTTINSFASPLLKGKARIAK